MSFPFLKTILSSVHPPAPLCCSRSCSLALCKPDGLEKNLQISLMGCSFLSNC